MPEVPRLTRQVGIDRLPGVRKTQAKTAISTGAGAAAAEANIGDAWGEFGARIGAQATGVYGAIMQQERNRADNVAVLEARNKLMRAEGLLLTDPTTGALRKKGKAALGLPEDVGAEFEKLAGEIEATLTTDAQKDAFRNIRMERGTGLELTLRRHVLGEMERWEGEELEARIVNAQDFIVTHANDPAKANAELADTVHDIKKHAGQLGWGPEQTDKAIKTVQSNAHVGIIDRLLEQENDKAAAIYYDEYKKTGQISGPAMAKIEKALEEGTLLGESQRQAKAIIDSGKTFKEQLEDVSKIDDPKLQDAVRGRVEHNQAVEERIERELEEKNLLDAYNIIEKTGNMGSIPAKLLAQIPGPSRSGLRAYAEHKVKGTPVTTNLATYTGLMKKASEDPQAFATTDLLRYRHELDEGDYKRMVTIKAEIVSGNREGASKAGLGDFLTNQQVIDTSLQRYGIPTSGKEQTDQHKTAAATLNRMVSDAVALEAQQTGKKPNQQFVQETVDRILSTEITAKTNNLWGFSAYNYEKKRLIDLTIADVPKEERASIIRELQQRGKPVSDPVILDLYMRAQLPRKK